jgi:protein-S-isoprenylcysteine O-methyltransferase Ste14
MKKRDTSELKMLDIAVVRVLSILFAVGSMGNLFAYGFFSKERKNLGTVKTSKHTGYILNQGWGLLTIFIPIIVYLLGAIVPDWVYKTVLNAAFGGAEYLQVASVPIFLLAVFTMVWSTRTLGQLMRPRVLVMDKQELVTNGPYSRIRHPMYTGCMLETLVPVFLYLNIVLVVLFFACVGVAYKRAVLEEELLASDGGYGQVYRDYMQKTGRFLPKLIQ